MQSYYDFDSNSVPRPEDDFERYIRRTCKELDISIEKLSKDAGVPRGTLYGLFEGTSLPKIPHLLQIAKVLKVHHYYLFRLKWPEFDMIDPERHETHKDGERNANGDACGFIDETVPDGTLILAGAEFEKSWTVQNVGNTVWKDRYYIHLDAPYYVNTLQNGHYPDGRPLTDYYFQPHETAIPLPVMRPGDTHTLSVRYTAPSVSGRYISYWRMVDDGGQFCFPKAIGLSVSILVRSFGVAV